MEMTLGYFGCVDTHTLADLESISEQQIHTTDRISDRKSRFTVSFGLSVFSFDQLSQPEMVIHSTSNGYGYLLSDDLFSNKKTGRKRNSCTFCNETTNLYSSIQQIELTRVTNPSPDKELLNTKLLSDENITQIYAIDSRISAAICEACAKSIENIRDALFAVHSDVILAWEI